MNNISVNVPVYLTTVTLNSVLRFLEQKRSSARQIAQAGDVSYSATVMRDALRQAQEDLCASEVTARLKGLESEVNAMESASSTSSKRKFLENTDHAGIEGTTEVPLPPKETRQPRSAQRKNKLCRTFTVHHDDACKSCTTKECLKQTCVIFGSGSVLARFLDS